MNITMLYSKLHRATVTEANLHYVGSITIDQELLDAANMRVGQKIDIVNINNGEINTNNGEIHINTSMTNILSLVNKRLRTNTTHLRFQQLLN